MRFGRAGKAAFLGFNLANLANVAAVATIAAACSQAPSLDPTPDPRQGPTRLGTTTEAVQAGVADTGNVYRFAVGVCGGNSPGQCDSICSGTLITPNLVVTARHCVDFAPHEIDCKANPRFGARHAAMFITTNYQIFSGPMSARHSVSKVIVPTDDHVCGHDIALLVLDGLIADTEAKPAVPGIQYPMGDLNRYVHRYAAVGYGNTGPEPSGTGAGTRRSRAGISIQCIPGDDIIACPADFPIADTEFFTGDGTCSGDSGSGAFEDRLFMMNKPLTFGVLSRGGDNANPDAGTAATLCKYGFYTRLDRYRDLVLQAAVAASANWTLYPKPVPDWTVFVPPPPDAGAPEAGPPKPKNYPNGTGCATGDDCKSKVCADTGGGLACTDACDESVMPTTCEAGFVCKAAVCIQDPGPPPTPAADPGSTTTTSGCAVASASGGPEGSRTPFGALGLVGAALLGLGLRRRRPAQMRISPD